MGAPACVASFCSPNTHIWSRRNCYPFPCTAKISFCAKCLYVDQKLTGAGSSVQESCKLARISSNGIPAHSPAARTDALMQTFVSGTVGAVHSVVAKIAPFTPYTVHHYPHHYLEKNGFCHLVKTQDKAHSHCMVTGSDVDPIP